MKKNVTALEISHRFIKVAFGYVQDGQAFVTFVKKYPTSQLIENGMVKEKAELVKELSKINPVVDADYQINKLINNVNFVLPPYGLEVYRTKQITSVISSERVIEEIDIRNIYSIIRNKKLPVENVLIDIIPESFKIDNGEKYVRAPIKKVSSAIEASVKVYTLPKRVDDEYSSLLRSNNIQIDRRIASSFAASELISSYSNTPKNYFLVDIGASSTSVSLIGNRDLFATRSFAWGGDNITDKIVSNFNINDSEAERIKIFFGLDKRKMNFEYPVSKIDTVDGPLSHSVTELNSLIESELENFNNMLQVCLEKIAEVYQISNINNIPLILIGGASQLKGLNEYLKAKNPNQSFTNMIPNTIGARDASLFSILGALYIDNKYPNTSINNSENKVNVAREE